MQDSALGCDHHSRVSVRRGADERLNGRVDVYQRVVLVSLRAAWITRHVALAVVVAYLLQSDAGTLTRHTARDRYKAVRAFLPHRRGNIASFRKIRGREALVLFESSPNWVSR